tara:strand:- start:473 stop:670 length:198 start_codon:yes stop_codon:yes gene_type:complete
MRQYKVRYRHGDMQEDYVGECIKWAHDEKSALKLVFKNNLDRNGFGILKRGARGKLINITEIPAP